MDEKEEIKEAYEHIIYRRKPLPYINLIKGKVVCDIGCGSGQNCLVLQKEKRFVICLDIALRQLIESKKRECENLIQADMEYLPFRDNSFDSLLYIASLHHLNDPSIAIKEGWRCLKNEGEVLATVWLIQFRFLFRKKIRIKSKIGNKEVTRIYKLYFPWELKKKMEKGGFKTLKYTLYSVDSFLPNNALYYGKKLL